MNLSEDIFKIRIDADCELNMSELTMSFAEEISLLEPFGVGNASPTFVMKDVNVKRISAIGGGKHTRLNLEKDGECVTALYFGVSESELGFESGDVIDVLFNIDINDYKNVRSVQMVLQDACLARSYSSELERQKNRYDEINNGGSFTMAEDIIPDRDDFAAVYKLLRREYRHENSITDRKTIMKQLSLLRDCKPINYIKLKYILRILNELNICEIEEIGDDIYRFSVIFNTSKTSIDKSSILKKLKSRCTDRIKRTADL